jgi:Tfp pilus assembly protein PilZ
LRQQVSFSPADIKLGGENASPAGGDLLSLAPRTLPVEFSTEAAFRSEYLSNIAKGGIFVATEETFEIRESVSVELRLGYCDRTIELSGEVVHTIPEEMAEAGALPGIAIQFTTSASELRSTFESLVGVVEGNERISRSGRRAAPRSPARVRIVVNSAGGTLECRTRDVSSSGILVSVVGEPIPVGDAISLLITHPQNDEQMQIEGTVVRHLTTERGEITAMGIEFHTPEARQTEISAFMNDVRAAEHSRRLGGITGPIAELGIENLLQMFGASSPQGTLTVTQGAEEGFIVFESGMLCVAQLGVESGSEALKHMLSWREGSFEFHARVDEIQPEGEGVPLNAAILDALCEIDEGAREVEGGRDDLGSLVVEDPSLELDLDDALELSFEHGSEARDSDEDADDGYESGVTPNSQPAQISPDSVFVVNTDATDAYRGELAKTEEAVLDLAGVGMTVARMLEVIPEAEIEVYTALDALLERRLLSCRRG